MHVGMLCLQKAEQDPAVEQIARIVSNRDGTRRQEYGILDVANLNRVDSDAVEESTAHAADVDFAFNLPLEHRRHHSPDTLLAEVGVRDSNEAENDDQQQPHQNDGASNRDAETACHETLERLTDREAERELAAEAVVFRRLVRRGAALWRHFLHDFRDRAAHRISGEVSRKKVEW